MGIYNTSKYGQSEYGAQAEHPYLNTPGKLMWLVQIDWDRDGDFGTEIEPQTIIELKFSRGRKERILTNGQGQDHPAQETCWLVIYDPDARYDSFNQASPLYTYLGASGMLMRFIAISTTGARSSTVFVGVLASATYDVNTQRATLQGEGLARLLQIGEAEHLYNVCQPSTLAEAGWESQFTLNVGNTPFPVNWWSGRPGGLYLRECVRLTLEAAGWSLGMYSGQTNYNDDYPDYYFLNGDHAWNHLRDLADAFAARLFFLRDGRLFVMDRQDAVALPTDGPFADPLLSYGLERKSPYEVLRNQIEMRVRPRAAQAPFKSPLIEAYYQEVWSNAGPISVPPNTVLYLDIEYLFNSQVAAGSWAHTNFVTNDWEAWSSPDKTGTNMYGGPAYYDLVLEDNPDGYEVPYGNNQCRSRVQLENTDLTRTAYFFNLKVLLIGMFETGNPAVVTAMDTNSIALNGRRILSINSPWVQRSDVATNVAQSYVEALASREKASPVTLAYFLSGSELHDVLTFYDVGSIIDFETAGGSISLQNYGMYGKWLIVGIDLEWVNPDGQDAIVKVTYEKMAMQVALVGTVSTTTANTSATPTWSHTVPAGANRLLVVQVGLRALQTVTGVTYGGVALTKFGAVQYSAGNFARAEIWYLVAPAVGTANVVVTISGAEVVEAAALNFINVNQTTPMDGFDATSGLGGSSAAVNPDSVEGDMVIDVLVKEGGTLSPGTGQTSRWTASADANWRAGGSTEVATTSSTTNMSWSLTGANAWVLAGVAVKSVMN